ncbi:MAG: aspartate/glutamate racemase family protein [Hyphomicrobiales bacterium]|nr:aspartate/glutamate racemase family protein [Hyphomicrobiales bacterium]
MHIGLIGGIGPAATEFYYRELVQAYAAADRTLDLTIVNASTPDLVRNLTNDTPDEQAEIFLRFVKRLEAAGADVAVVTSLGGHFCIRQLEAISPLPLINAIPALDAYFANEGIESIGLIGTRNVMQSRLYGGVTSVEIIVPEGDELQATHDNYVAMAAMGAATDAQREFFVSLGERMCRRQGADAIALGGTDLYVVFDGTDCGYRVIDCAKVHIDAIVARAFGG